MGARMRLSWFGALLVVLGLLHAVAPAAATQHARVDRAAGPDRYATAADLSSKSYEQAEVVLVATGERFPDALAGGPAIAGLGPILLVTRDRVPDATRGELLRLQPDVIVVLGGTAAVSDAVLSELDRYAAEGAVRIAGRDRYETAAEIAEAAFEAPPVVYVASGEEFADALAAGAAAGWHDGPVLLTQRDRVPGATRRALSALRPRVIVVTGGAARISDAVIEALTPYASDSVVRVSGPDRYATAAAVSRHAFTDAPIVFVATGRAFPDALAGGAIGGAVGGPLLLVPGTSVPGAVRCEIERLRPEIIVILGGPAAVSAEVEQELAAGYPQGEGICAPGSPEAPPSPVPPAWPPLPRMPSAPATSYQLDPANTGARAAANPDRAPVRLAWERDMPGRPSYPIVADGRVFVTLADHNGSPQHGVIALDARSGEELWRDALTYASSLSWLAYDAGALYLLTPSGLLEARDPATGHIRWTVDLQARPNAPPTATGGRVYVAASQRVMAVDGSSGALIWAQPVLGESSTPAVADGRLFVAYGCQRVYAMDAVTGAPLWLSGRAACVSEGAEIAAVHDDLVYAIDRGFGNAILDARTGAFVGQFPGVYVPAVSTSGAALIGPDGRAVLFRNPDGTIRWQHDAASPAGPAMLVGDTVFVVTDVGELVVLDAADGREVWQHGGYPQRPLMRHGHVGLAAGEGILVVSAPMALRAYMTDA